MQRIQNQRGISLTGLIFMLAIVGFIALLGMKIVPTVTEYTSVKSAIKTAKASGTTERDIRLSFDKQADASYISSISGKDLEITKNGNGFEISFAYEKKIPLFGPASLVLDYSGSTENAHSAKIGGE